MQRAEWIRYLAPFVNAEARANAVYGSVKFLFPRARKKVLVSNVQLSQVKSNYLCLSKMAANQSGKFKPVVAWVEYKEV